MKATELIKALQQYADKDPDTEVTIALSVSAKGVVTNKNFIIRDTHFPMKVQNDSRTALEQSNHVVLIPPEMDETAMALWEAKHRKGGRKNTQATAHWIITYDRTDVDGIPLNAFTCSGCNRRGSFTKFCPHCGTLMSEEPTFPEAGYPPKEWRELAIKQWRETMEQ